MKSQSSITRSDAWVRFQLGDYVCTVVSDGLLEMGPARLNFPEADPAEVDALLVEHHLSPDNMVLNQNVLIVDTGEHLVMFDTGVGIDSTLGATTFGEQTGQTLRNLRASGIEPEDIDVVAITHAHPDHCWGLADENGDPLYPNAQLAISRTDFEFWSDLDKAKAARSRGEANHFIGGHKNLVPYRGRTIFVSDGHDVVPGVRAMATPGHSPGHVVYEIQSGNETLVCWGDLCHHQVLLLKRPQWNLRFDHDDAAATAQRLRILDEVTTKRHQVLSYHFPFPGRGHLRRNGNQYEWLPIEVEFRLPEGVALGIPEDSPLRDT